MGVIFTGGGRISKFSDSGVNSLPLLFPCMENTILSYAGISLHLRMERDLKIKIITIKRIAIQKFQNKHQQQLPYNFLRLLETTEKWMLTLFLLIVLKKYLRTQSCLILWMIHQKANIFLFHCLIHVDS